MSRMLVPVVLLTIVYVMVLASSDPWDFLVGAMLAVGIALLFRRHLPSGPHRFIRYPARLLWFAVFAGAVAWEITVGAWTVLGVVLRLRPLGKPGVVAIPIEGSTRAGIAVFALVLTISPGTYLLDVDWERREMLIHALDSSHPDLLRTHFRRFYERYQRNLFP